MLKFPFYDLKWVFILITPCVHLLIIHPGSSTPLVARRLLNLGSEYTHIQSSMQYSSSRTHLFNSDTSFHTLPVCSSTSVCNRINNFTGQTEVHRICKCPLTSHSLSDKKGDGGSGNFRENTAIDPCPISTNISDGFTFSSDGQYYTMCRPLVRTLPQCRYFRDTTFVITSYPSRKHIQQTMRCICPNGSSTYLAKWMQKHNSPHSKIIYHYACSPPSHIECTAKEPCALFVSSSAKNIHRQNVCACPSGTSCPENLADGDISVFDADIRSNATTYAAYCSFSKGSK
ncbi:protein giant-lens-like [Paramacrobiotus metropolitanus]|uniref:protein giant-lens-like n=1 Tax=Paramacrobiotus metropolitanus TaxID=2943436 RepID=UPI002446565D|nr:protein giant-lens-like [Paramacrobiotus metropolitanus]